MGQLKELKLARRPPRLRTLTDIEAPSVKKERVNGKDKYTMTDAKPGVITIYSDDENDKNHISRSRAIKRERSQIPSHVARHGSQSNEPRVKRESSPHRRGRHQSCGQTSPAAAASVTRQKQTLDPLRGSGSHGKSDPPSDSSSSSDSSGSDSSDSSESEAESDSSSDSSSSDGSSSEDEASASVYRPSTPASSIGPSPPRTRRNKEASGRLPSANPEVVSPSRRPVQNRTSVGSRHAPLDFVIDVPVRPLPSRPQQAGRSRSQTLSTAVPTGAQADRSAHSNHHRPGNSSPVVLGFMPINRGLPPKNAPTEPRAMRNGHAGPAGMSVRAPQRPNLPGSDPVPGSSSLPFRGLQPVKDRSQQKDQQRRGPARPGRVMQTIEQPPVELFSSKSPLKNGSSSSHLRPATPGPSSRRTAPPQQSPGIFVTPRAVSVRPHSAPRSPEVPQSVSRSRGKRTFDESGDADPVSKAEEWERVLEKIKNHEREMEQQRALLERMKSHEKEIEQQRALLEKLKSQEKELEQQRAQDRAQLEDTKRLLAEQKARIDDLEQRREAEQLVRNPDVRTQSEERDASAPSEAVPRDVAPPPEVVRRHVTSRRETRHRSERREGRRRRKSSRVAQAHLREQERQRIEQDKQEELELGRRRLDLERQEELELKRQRLEQERQEDLELQQQLEQEQRREAERLHRAVRRLQNNAQRVSAQMQPESQRRIQHEVFTRPLSGVNPDLEHDDDDRPYLSHATAFLLRLPQAFVLRKLQKLVEGKAFFDVTHPGSVHMGCWVVSSKRVSHDMRMKLTESGEQHGFSFARLAVRMWHDEVSIYSLLQHKHRASNTCHTDDCMHPDHIVVESVKAAGERRRCKREGRCRGHVTVHKDGTRQVRRPCIFAPQGASIRR